LLEKSDVEVQAYSSATGVDVSTGRIKPEDVGLRVEYPSAYPTRALREGRVSKVYA